MLTQHNLEAFMHNWNNLNKSMPSDRHNEYFFLNYRHLVERDKTAQIQL